MNLRDKLVKVLGLKSTLIIWIVLCGFFMYVTYTGTKSISHYGFINIFFNDEFNLTDNKASFWPPLFITLLLASIVVFLVIPVAIRCSIWICFSCSKRIQKAIDTVLLLLANLPSIVLAMFVREYLAKSIQTVFRLKTTLNLVTAIFALTIMILPLIITLFNAVIKDKRTFITNVEVLGISKQYSIYKVLLPKIKSTRILAISLVFCRVLSESIMLSILLSAENYSSMFKHGFVSFISSQLNSISPLIASNFFADGSTTNKQNLMFLFGSCLLAIALIFNAICLLVIKKLIEKNNSTSKISLIRRIKNWILWNTSKYIYSYKREYDKGKISIDEYIHRYKNTKSKKISEKLKKLIELVSVLCVASIGILILGSIVTEGIIAFTSTSYDSLFKSNNNSLLTAATNTGIIILLCLTISIPIALFSSLYLSEYCTNKKFKKITLSLVNASSSVPSIIFGIFGLSLFIYRFKLSISGAQGKSLLAAILTMTILIIPYLTQLFYTHISSVTNNYREASYVLGTCKYKTFTKIILPLIAKELVFSSLLAVGKIMGETAPIYLTAGISSAPKSLLLYQGQTLTTRIYSQLSANKIAESNIVIRETTLVCICFMTLIIVLGKYALPKTRKTVFYKHHKFLRYRMNYLAWNIKKYGI